MEDATLPNDTDTSPEEDVADVAASRGAGPRHGEPAARHESRREKKLGHRRVDDEGIVTYKKKSSREIMNAIQLGIYFSTSQIQGKEKRDVLLTDFGVIETIAFPKDGGAITPKHPNSDFRFRVYAPYAFRHFRELFGVDTKDFMNSLCTENLKELSNPGASGSIFYITRDDEFIIKTVQHKEASFLRKLLPEYYMNLNQNPRTLLPKFYGLFCYQSAGKNIRFIIMNNLLPSSITMHEKYDLKGSTFKRAASTRERAKTSPTLKDLDFREQHGEGLYLEAYDALLSTIERDCRVLESFRIMDYSLLLGIHNLDLAKKERTSSFSNNDRKQMDKRNCVVSRNEQRLLEKQQKEGAAGDSRSNAATKPKASPAQTPTPRPISAPPSSGIQSEETEEETQASSELPRVCSKDSNIGKRLLQRSRSARQRIALFSTAMESIQAAGEPVDLEKEEQEWVPPGGIPARNEKGERLLLFVGIIDILQNYRFLKKMEHRVKSIAYDGDTISVHNPSFYKERFQHFFKTHVFHQVPSSMRSQAARRRAAANMASDGGAPGTSVARPRFRTASVDSRQDSATKKVEVADGSMKTADVDETQESQDSDVEYFPLGSRNSRRTRTRTLPALKSPAASEVVLRRRTLRPHRSRNRHGDVPTMSHTVTAV